jgi:hypothetical protein
MTNNNELTNASIEAVDFYSADLGEDVTSLYASEEEVAQLAKEGELGQEFMLKQVGQGGGGKKYDNSWSYHRTIRIGKKEYLEWSANPTKEERESGLIGEELDLDDPSQQFVAVRGIILKYEWGAELRGNHNGNSKLVCRTTGLIEKLPGKDRVSVSNHPIKQPFKMMHKNRQEKSTPNYFFINNPHLIPQAERYDLSRYNAENLSEYYKSAQPRNCLDCIRCGENSMQFDDGEGLCKPVGQVLMCVFQLGRKDTTRYNEDNFENSIDIEWVDVADANIQDYRGETLDRPFILCIDRIGKSQLESVGSGKWDIPVKLPKDFDAKRRKSYYLPNDNVMSIGDYYKWLHSKDGAGHRIRSHKAGFPVYPVMTELYSAKLKQEQYTKDYAPVFNPVPLDEDGCFNGIHIDQFVNAALRVARQEADKANGKEVDFSAVNAIAPAPKSKKKRVVASTNNRSLNSIAAAAFSVTSASQDDDED